MNKIVLRKYRRHRGFKPETFETMPPGGPVLFREGEDQTFYHSGDFGDIIYALPTMRALGGGILILGPELNLSSRVKLRQSMTRDSVAMFRPLLELQPYVHEVRFAARQPKVNFDLNIFREELFKQFDNMRAGQRMLNLAECHLKQFRLSLQDCQNGWLVVDRETRDEDRPVVIHRSSRWRNPDFPWPRILEQYGDRAVFVGLPLEHEFFCADFGVELPFVPTKDFLELARVIAGSSLYIGNQSLPYAIAEGLKKNSLLEVWPEGPNCYFQRKNANYGLGKNVYIPKLKLTMTQERLTKCPHCNNPMAEPFRTKADIVRCLGCSLIYLRTRMTPSSMVHLYQSYADGNSHMKCPERTADVASSGLRRQYFMDYLLKHVEMRRGHLLDIGCGWGAFMANARRNGFTTQGIEVCHKMADFGDSILGLDIRTEQLTDLELPDESCDVVVALHSLEHVPHLTPALETIRRILRPGGVFAGIVPNIGSFCSDRLKDNWKWLDPNYHYLYFTPESLAKVLSRFEPVDMHTETGDYGPDDVHRQLLAASVIPLSEDELALQRAQLNESMKGEEIRFLVRKPS